MSSSCWGVVGPGGGFVVGSLGLEASVQDSDEAVAELAERGAVADSSGSELVVVRPVTCAAR